MSDEKRTIEYELRIIAEYGDGEDVVLLEVNSAQPFSSFHVGDKLWAKGLKPSGIDAPPKPHLYDGYVVVKEVRHALWEYEDGNRRMLHQGIEAVVQDPYEIDE